MIKEVLSIALNLTVWQFLPRDWDFGFLFWNRISFLGDWCQLTWPVCVASWNYNLIVGNLELDTLICLSFRWIRRHFRYSVDGIFLAFKCLQLAVPVSETLGEQRSHRITQPELRYSVATAFMWLAYLSSWSILTAEDIDREELGNSNIFDYPALVVRHNWWIWALPGLPFTDPHLVSASRYGLLHDL